MNFLLWLKSVGKTRLSIAKSDKPKNKHDEQIDAMTSHYLSIIDSGLNLYEFKPEPPAGNMATNRYAQAAYTNQLVAFARAIGINSERSKYFEEGD